jgi:hypothetical protein
MAKPSLSQQLAAAHELIAVMVKNLAEKEAAAALLAATPQPAVAAPKELRSTVFMGKKVYVGQALQSFEIRVGEDKDVDLAERTARGHAVFLIKKLADNGVRAYLRPVTGAIEVCYK